MTAPESPQERTLLFPRREVEALLDHIFEYGTTAEGVTARIEAVIRAALAEPSPVGGEPVGYVHEDAFNWQSRQSEVVRKITRNAQPEHGFIVPLYLHSPRAQLASPSEPSAGSAKEGA